MRHRQRRAVFQFNNLLGSCNYSLFTPGAGNAFSQDRVDFIQYLALIGTLWESLLVDAFFAGAFDQITDFEIVFKFKRFFCHYNVFQRVKI
jgi:hypothetical protein